ncbi:hypothetical protein KJ359_001918 [Pestalotiopsis sp. 9143b]|nr:hypothetical protein KJ359_001918 [Pestalotiopsis sp. 9143b]
MTKVIERTGEAILSGAALAHTCDDLLVRLSRLQEPLGSGAKALLSPPLAIIAKLLRSTQAVEERTVVQNAFHECSQALSRLGEIQATSNSVDYSSIVQNRIGEQARALTDVMNILSLTLNISSVDAGQTPGSIRAIKEGLDAIARDLMASLDDIMPGALPVPSKGAFELRAREEGSMTYSTVCSGCNLLEHNTSKARLRFACHCPESEGSHDGELQYQALSSTSLIENIYPHQERVWHMIVRKPQTNTLVSLIITAATETGVHNIESLAQSLAVRRMEKVPSGTIGRSKNGEIIYTNELILRLTSLSPPEAFAARLPSKVEIKTCNQDAVLGWKPKRMQMGHYFAAPYDPALVNSRSLKSFDFVPSSEFEVRILEHAEKNSPRDFNIFLHRSSCVVRGAAPRGPLWVTLSQIDIREDMIPGDDWEISFGFNELQDAKNFESHVTAMQDRMQQLYVQGPYASEREIYHQESTTLEKTASKSLEDQPVIVSVISQDPPTSFKDGFRMILKRNGLPSSVCFELTSKTMKLASQGSNYQNQMRIWTYDIDGSNRPVAQQTNWVKLTGRGKGRKQSQAHRLGGPQVLRDGETSSEEWLDKIEELSNAMKEPASDKSRYKAVKVCVIDTGLDPRYGTSRRVNNRVKEFKDFVTPSSSSMQDNTSHGTVSVSIVLSVFEHCELYVARVFKSDDTDEKTEPELMAKAIEWSLEPEIDVDIISISAGFVHHSPRLQDAVRKASGASKLIFAAASNWGNLGPVAYPARHNYYTICVFSVDTHHRPSRFNPERRPNADNFAILGEDFSHPIHPNHRVSGTSAATAAAAGLAAMIIDFSRHGDNVDTIVRAADVSTMAGMIAIFDSMAVRAGEFKCIVPLNLLPTGYRDMSVQRKRKYIRDSLSRAMDQAN